jgi:uncharacterized membrane protein
MSQFIALLNLLSVATFAGGSLCLSITLSALTKQPAREGAWIMHRLLPGMGTIMAPLLATALLSGLYVSVLGLRGFGHGTSSLIAAAVFAAIVVVTVSVHLPLNAQLLAEPVLPALQAGSLLRRWLVWHHLRTALALSALIVLLWPLRASLLARVMLPV